jgi:hypothetical protein
VERECDECGEVYTAQRSTSKYCSDLCRKRALRNPQGGEPVVTGAAAAVRRELELAGRLDTALGQIALELATALESPKSTGSAKASLARELAVAMDRALAGVAVADDPMDELKRVRDRKRGLA